MFQGRVRPPVTASSQPSRQTESGHSASRSTSTPSTITTLLTSHGLFISALWAVLNYGAALSATPLCDHQWQFDDATLTLTWRRFNRQMPILSALCPVSNFLTDQTYMHWLYEVNTERKLTSKHLDSCMSQIIKYIHRFPNLKAISWPICPAERVVSNHTRTEVVVAADTPEARPVSCSAVVRSCFDTSDHRVVQCQEHTKPSGTSVTKETCHYISLKSIIQT